MKQLSTEWLWQQLLALYAGQKLGMYTPEEFINKQVKLLTDAKQMEKERLMEAWDSGWLECSTTSAESIDAEEYYEQTYERNPA